MCGRRRDHRGGHEGKTYRLSGPAPLLPADRVRILATVLGRELRFEGLPDEGARAEMSAAMPEKYVDAFFDFYETAPSTNHQFCQPSRTSQDGHPARSTHGHRHARTPSLTKTQPRCT